MAMLCSRDESPRQADEFVEFLAGAQGGKLVAVEGVQMDRPFVDGIPECFLFCRGGILQIAIHRPQTFRVPEETGVGRIVAGLFAQFDRLLEERPLHPLDLGLDMRVADIQVRLVDQVELPLADRLQGKLTIP